MKKASEIYKEGSWYDYDAMLFEFGYAIIKHSCGEYQGDTFVIYEDDSNEEIRYGFLSFSWGSCSGCDALMACNSINDVQGLMDRLYSSICWFDNLKALKEYFTNDEILKGSHFWYVDGFDEFRNKVLKLNEI